MSLSSLPGGHAPADEGYATCTAGVRSICDLGAYTQPMRALPLLVLCFVLAACGHDSKPAASTTQQPAIVPVDMKNNQFAPKRIVVHVGQEVRWTNRDPESHTVASQALKLSSEAIGSARTFSYRPRRAGRFKYFCTIHARQTGLLVVRR
jgi:plastocyanin